MPDLTDKLAALMSMDRTALREEWEGVYQGPAPALSADLLRLGIAYRLQEKALGGLSKASAAEMKGTGTGRPTIGPGTRLVRSWNGRTISVEAQDGGFVFEDRRYSSLSAIARKITGTNWSGPRFFGLDRQPSP